ncbi:unnamed protein product [Cylindrotheca closterium]|uniref:Cation/H+ exchanger transmembrane domain-containing protein n=1 Tax=Cylindrotheca closterium TaxID=2856 RepID=A0AAD2JNM6_9STRA|nr:unnamed protein product [Cylindrotheca closterium]
MKRLRVAVVHALILQLTCATDEITDTHGHEAPEAPHAVLFPSLTLTLGVIVFYVLSRYAKALPYTAVMFLIGTIMGIATEFLGSYDHVGQSIRLWIGINSEVLLLVFLPGLLFRDAMSQNVHLFWHSLYQLLIFAFPMVLAGTVLTALVAYYIFPYNWPFNLAMAFGAILAATDPVAVAALLDEVGAPPRLKIHIAGESLLNDGAAIVFFSIFVGRYFYEDLDYIGGKDHSEDIDLSRGVAMFFQKALGGAAVGVFFGLGQLILLFILHRRVSREENIVQVTSVVGMAYLNFYTADYVWHTSGVISTVVAGLIVKLLGRGSINDLKLLEDFLCLLEHLLNTVLFVLGGIVWGAVVATGEKLGKWGGIDWAYLALLYIMLLVIRGFLFALVYPVTSRIGLKSDPKETLFQVYGGLRGALGIALAIALDNEVAALAGGRFETEAELHTTQAFVMVGGIAMMTLVINGITAGPLLRKLGLADSTDARSMIIKTLQVEFRSLAIDDFVRLLAQPRFYHTDFSFVKKHVPFLGDLTRTQFLDSARKYKNTHGLDSAPPFLKNILPDLENDKTPSRIEEEFSDEEVLADFDNYVRKKRLECQSTKAHRPIQNRRQSSNVRAMMGEDALSAKELRLLFVSIMRAQYEKQISRGELENEHFLAIALDQSLDFASHDIHKGRPLQDWKHLTELHDPMARLEARAMKTLMTLSCGSLNGKRSGKKILGCKVRSELLLIERAMAFMAAHEESQKLFHNENEDMDNKLSKPAKRVIQESLEQYASAQYALKHYDKQLVQKTASRKLCKILLNQTMYHVEKFVHMGALKESEAEHLIEEYLHSLHGLLESEEDVVHPEGVVQEFCPTQSVINPVIESSAQLVKFMERLSSAVDDKNRSAMVSVREGPERALYDSSAELLVETEEEDEDNRSRELKY